jgi:hypothetical protein
VFVLLLLLFFIIQKPCWLFKDKLVILTVELHFYCFQVRFHLGLFIYLFSALHGFSLTFLTKYFIKLLLLLSLLLFVNYWSGSDLSIKKQFCHHAVYLFTFLIPLPLFILLNKVLVASHSSVHYGDYCVAYPCPLMYVHMLFQFTFNSICYIWYVMSGCPCHYGGDIVRI